MQIGRLHIGSARHLAAPVQPPPGGELGVDGDTWINRYLAGGPDTNPELNGPVKFDIYEEMAIADATCKALLSMLELPIVGAVWDFVPSSSQPFDELVAEACRWQFGLAGYEGQLDQSWKRSLRQGLLKNRYGAMFEEVVWADAVTTFTPKGAPDAARLVKPIARLAPRLPRTVISAPMEKGGIVEVKQSLSDAKAIPGGRDARKLCYYVLDPRPGRWDGTSLLRAAWGPWKLKTELMIASGIAWDRWASGIPVVRYPGTGGNEEKEKADEIGRSVRNHERSYLSFAGPKPTETNPNGWDFSIEGGPGNLPNPVELLKQYDLAILTSGLAQWMGVAISTKTGARATVQVQDEPYYMALEANAEDLALERQRQAVRYFVDVNFGVDVDAPKLAVSKIQSEDVAQFAQTVAELKLAGFDFSDIPVQNDVRERLHLPTLPEDATIRPTEGSGLPPAPPLPAPADE